MRRALALVVALSGCGGGAVCEQPGDDLVAASGDVAALTCEDARAVPRLVGMLGARGVPSHEVPRVLKEVGSAYQADPAATRRRVDAAAGLIAELEGLRGLDAAERRSTLAYDALHGAEPIGALPGVEAYAKSTIGVWATSDAHRLVLTEMDMEGWIRYASLCREAQAGGPLVLSVADRSAVYRAFAEAFDGASRADQVALTAIGPFWYSFKVRWQSASAEDQQAWIASAPLPPPMTGTSLDYAEAIAGSDVGRHAMVLHGLWGPMRLEPR